jgi:hypothetical protein
MDQYEGDFDTDNAEEHEADNRLVDNKPEQREANHDPFSRLLDVPTAERPADRAKLAKLGKHLPRNVDDENAIRQRLNSLASARMGFDMTQLDDLYAKPTEPPGAANDNDPGFKHKESWPLEEIIKRSKRTDAAELLETAIRLRQVYDMANADPLGETIHRPGKPHSAEYGMQRTATGNFWYDNGQTLDRKRSVYDGKKLESGKRRPLSKNGEEYAVRHDGSVRTSARSQFEDRAFDAERDDLFSQRKMDAANELADIRAAVGEGLWGPLEDAVCNNMTFAEIAVKEGDKRHTDASALVWRGLRYAHKARVARQAAASYRDYVTHSGLPVPGERWLRAAA